MNSRLTKLFLHRFVRYLVICLIPVLIVSSFALIRTRSTVIEQARLHDKEQLTSLQTDIESIVAATSFQKQLLTISTSFRSSIYSLQSTTDYSYADVAVWRLITNILSSSVSGNPNIQSVYFYFEKGNFLYSTQQGFVPVEQMEDTGWLESISRHSHGSSTAWMSFRDLSQMGFTRSVLSIYQRIPAQECTIVINITTNQLRQYFDQYCSECNSPLIYMLDKQGDLLFSSDDNSAEFYDSLSESDFQTLSSFMEQNSHQYLEPVVLHDSVWYVSYIHSYLYDVTYLSLTSTDDLYAPYSQTLFFVILVIAMSLILCLLIALLITGSNFRQIRFLLNAFNGKTEPPQASRKRLWGEYDAIFQNIVNSYVKQKDLEKSAITSEMQKKDAQIAMLQAQINPHFLMNTLQLLQIEAAQCGPQGESMVSIIDNLSALLRSSLQSTDSVVTVESALNDLRRYTSILYHHYGDRFIIYFDYPEEVRNQVFMRLGLQPLVENCVKHGKVADRKVYIRIKIRIRDGYLHWRITDNGAGISKERLSELRENLEKCIPDHHIGIYNVNQRLVLHFGNASRLHIWSKENLGTSIYFITPYHPD